MEKKRVAGVSDAGSHPELYITAAGESGKRNSTFCQKGRDGAAQLACFLKIVRFNNGQSKFDAMVKPGLKNSKTIFVEEQRAGVVTWRWEGDFLGGDFFFFWGGEVQSPLHTEW